MLMYKGLYSKRPTKRQKWARRVNSGAFEGWEGQVSDAAITTSHNPYHTGLMQGQDLYVSPQGSTRSGSEVRNVARFNAMAYQVAWTLPPGIIVHKWRVASFCAVSLNPDTGNGLSLNCAGPYWAFPANPTFANVPATPYGAKHKVKRDVTWLYYPSDNAAFAPFTAT